MENQEIEFVEFVCNGEGTRTGVKIRLQNGAEKSFDFNDLTPVFATFGNRKYRIEFPSNKITELKF